MISQNLFDAFNARAITPAKVGSSFVYHDALKKMVSGNHAVVVGPRGIGKTTYFKMLTLPALKNWKSRQKIKIIEKKDFQSVYVPTDFTWYPDFRRPLGLTLDPDIESKLSYARFRNNMLKSIVDSLSESKKEEYRNDKYLNRYYLDIDKNAEEEISKLLSDAWGLAQTFSGFFGLQLAINKRNRSLQRLGVKAYSKPLEVNEILEGMEFIHDSIYSDLVDFGDIVDEKVEASQKWAICFDEVEIAPESVKSEIYSSLRSFDERFLIKLSASPYDNYFSNPLRRPTEALKNQDYEEIWLTINRSAQIEKFSEKILEGICEDLKLDRSRAKNILGSSYYDDDFDFQLSKKRNEAPKKETKKSPNKTGFYKRKFSSLALKDKSFAEFLSKTSIDIEEFDELSGNKRAFIRKFISTVVIRDAYLFNAKAENQKRLKSKKSIDRFYTGKTALFNICEGNPRWLIVVLRPILERYVENYKNSTEVPREIQTQSLESAISTIVSMLSTISLDRENSKYEYSVIELIELIGDYFFEQVLGKDFVAEPYLSFDLDSKIDPILVEAIGACVNQGAMVIIPAPKTPNDLAKIHTEKSIIERRIRLSYFLSPRYRLPMVRGRSRKLSQILSEGGDDAIRESQIMLDLFGDYDDH